MLAEISPKQVMELRQRTGVGMMECKKALAEANGDLDMAIENLRKRGAAKAASKADRAASEGLVESYIHPGGRVGVLVEINCETDFVARTDEFQNLVRALAIQVAGLSPKWVDVDQIPAEVLAEKRAELAADPTAAAKPAEIREKSVDGQLKKWFKDVVLLEQPFRDTEQTVRELVTDAIASLKENIQVRRFARYALGEDV